MKKGLLLLCLVMFLSFSHVKMRIQLRNLLIDNQHDVFMLNDSLINISAFSAIDDSIGAQNSTNLLAHI